MNEVIPDQVLENLLAAMQEGERLKTLSNEELVIEYLEAEDDELIGMEMCERLSPGITEAQGH